MAFELTGNVEVLRIIELLTKVLAESDLANYYVAIDNENDEDTKNVSLAAILAFVGGSTSSFDDSLFEVFNNADPTKLIKLSASSITTATTITLTIPDKDIVIGEAIHKPTTQPPIIISAPNTLTLDCNSAEQAAFEPRLSVGTLTINVDFDYLLTNAGNTLIIDQTIQLTGTRIISFPSTGSYEFLVSNPSSLGAWDDVLKELTITAGTDDIIEISMKKYNSPTLSTWLIKVSEIAI